jgi:hypothetical protein
MQTKRAWNDAGLELGICPNRRRNPSRRADHKLPGARLGEQVKLRERIWEFVGRNEVL